MFKVEKAKFVGTVPLEMLKLPTGIKQWEPYETEDILATGVVTVPSHYMLTMGSGIFFSPQDTMLSSSAITPSYQLPTASQYYVAGRDVIRWGGEKDPYEIDYDHYLFTPEANKVVAIVSKAPKSEWHHFSQNPQRIDALPGGWREIFEAIRQGKFP